MATLRWKRLPNNHLPPPINAAIKRPILKRKPRRCMLLSPAQVVGQTQRQGYDGKRRVGRRRREQRRPRNIQILHSMCAALGVGDRIVRIVAHSCRSHHVSPSCDVEFLRPNAHSAKSGTHQLRVEMVAGSAYLAEIELQPDMGDGLVQEVPTIIGQRDSVLPKRRHFSPNMCTSSNSTPAAAENIVRAAFSIARLESRRRQRIFVAELGRQCNGVNDPWRVFVLHLLEFQFIQHQVNVLIQMRMLAKAQFVTRRRGPAIAASRQALGDG